MGLKYPISRNEKVTSDASVLLKQVHEFNQNAEEEKTSRIGDKMNPMHQDMSELKL